MRLLEKKVVKKSDLLFWMTPPRKLGEASGWNFLFRVRCRVEILKVISKCLKNEKNIHKLKK